MSLDIVPVNFKAFPVSNWILEACTGEDQKEAIGRRCSGNDILLLSVPNALF